MLHEAHGAVFGFKLIGIRQAARKGSKIPFVARLRGFFGLNIQAQFLCFGFQGLKAFADPGAGGGIPFVVEFLEILFHFEDGVQQSLVWVHRRSVYLTLRYTLD